MLSESEVTFHLRRIIESGDREDLTEGLDESMLVLKSELDKWASESRSDQDKPPSVIRIERFIRSVQGEEIDFKEDPWLIVSLIIYNFESRLDGMVDLMPCLQGIGLATEWNGTDGEEPDWLIELDRVLSKYYYPDLLNGFEESEKSDIFELSIRDRANCFDVFR